MSEINIRNIIFDLGEVLLTGDDPWLFQEETKKLLDADQDSLIKGWDEAWPKARDGQINEDEFFKIILRHTNNDFSLEYIEKLKNIYRESIKEKGAYPALEKLKGKYRLFGLTNITNEWLEYKRTKFNLDKYLELIVASSVEGIAKPHREIYQILINKGGIKPEECVFVDDLERNLITARDMGFNTICFNEYGQMVEEFKKFGVLL